MAAFDSDADRKVRSILVVRADHRSSRCYRRKEVDRVFEADPCRAVIHAADNPEKLALPQCAGRETHDRTAAGPAEAPLEGDDLRLRRGRLEEVSGGSSLVARTSASQRSTRPAMIAEFGGMLLSGDANYLGANAST
jgi:hypothetical protein